MSSFDYPNAAAPSTTVTGMNDKLSIDRETDLGYVMIETAGRVLKTARLGEDVEMLPLKLKNITDAIKTSLKTFMDNIIQGPTNSFSYTDDTGTTYNNCRLVTPRYSFRRTSLSLWELDLLLRVDP
jgi:hypothetical protein